MVRIRSGFGSDPDPTSQHRPDRIRILFSKTYLSANFIIIKVVMPHSFFYSQINEIIEVLAIHSFY
jgi:hypothetical protein